LSSCVQLSIARRVIGEWTVVSVCLSVCHSLSLLFRVHTDLFSSVGTTFFVNTLIVRLLD